MPFNRSGAMKLLHILAARADFAHEDLRTLAATMFRIDPAVVSLGKLSDNQLLALLRHFNGGNANAATTRQVWLIHQLEAQLGWAGNPARLEGFVHRQTGGRALGQLTKDEAAKLIESLKHMEVAHD